MDRMAGEIERLDASKGFGATRKSREALPVIEKTQVMTRLELQT
jgi:hypothetical protein